MLVDQLGNIASEGSCTCEPLVDDNAQCILVAGVARLTADLFRCRIMGGAGSGAGAGRGIPNQDSSRVRHPTFHAGASGETNPLISTLPERKGRTQRQRS